MKNKNLEKECNGLVCLAQCRETCKEYAGCLTYAYEETIHQYAKFLLNRGKQNDVRTL